MSSWYMDSDEEAEGKPKFEARSHEEKPRNGKQKVERVLSTISAFGDFAAKGYSTTKNPFKIVLFKAEGGGGKQITFPMNAADVETFKSMSRPSPVGTRTSESVIPTARTSHELLPHQFRVSERLQLKIQGIVRNAGEQLGVTAVYKVEATPYKMLLYEPGCFFKKHRDNERLPNMFGTLVIQLSSEFTGCELRVWPPGNNSAAFPEEDGFTQDGQRLAPPEAAPAAKAKGFTYRHNAATAARPAAEEESTQNDLIWSAFYADCYHEVTELTSGSRVCLIYNLCSTMVIGGHNYAVPLAPPQPRPDLDRKAEKLAAAMRQFDHEESKDYRFQLHRNNRYILAAKPDKFVVVLSHLYTRLSLKENGAAALKGRDRVVGDLILRAQQPQQQQQQQQQKQQKLSKSSAGPEMEFDAYLTFADFWVWGTGVPRPRSYISGERVYSLDPKNAETAVLPFALGRSGILPIYVQEVLFEDSDEASKKSDELKAVLINDSSYALEIKAGPEEVEFLGNGAIPSGRAYEKACIIFWPRSHRGMVQLQWNADITYEEEGY